MHSVKTRRTFLIGCMLACFSGVCFAEERVFPAQTKRGKLTITAQGDVIIDGKLRNITPSTRVYSEEGLIVPIASVAANKLLINFTLNDFGDVEKIWLLTADEASRPSQKKAQ